MAAVKPQKQCTLTVLLYDMKHFTHERYSVILLLINMWFLFLEKSVHVVLTRTLLVNVFALLLYFCA